MAESAENSDRSAIASRKRKAPPIAAKPSPKSAPKLSLVPPGLGGKDDRAPTFVAGELRRARDMAVELRTCDAANDREFAYHILRASQPEYTGLEQRDLATRLMINPLTLQRWARGGNLPFAIPRRGYLDALALIVDQRVHTLESGGIDILDLTPRRGARPAKKRDITP